MGGDNGQDHSNNCRIYFSGMPTDTTEDEVRELFSGIGVIGRIRQKRGYKDQVGPPSATNICRWAVYPCRANNRPVDCRLSYPCASMPTCDYSLNASGMSV
jgi:hypothetical protein